MKKLLILLVLLTIVLFSGCIKQRELEDVGMKPSEQTATTTVQKLNTIDEINNNPENFENKLVKVTGLFYFVIGKNLFNNNCDHLGTADYKLVDPQGLNLFINAPNRDLSYYHGKIVTVEGVVKITYDNCEKLGYYLEFSKISE